MQDIPQDIKILSSNLKYPQAKWLEKVSLQNIIGLGLGYLRVTVAFTSGPLIYKGKLFIYPGQPRFTLI